MAEDPAQSLSSGPAPDPRRPPTTRLSTHGEFQSSTAFTSDTHPGRNRPERVAGFTGMRATGCAQRLRGLLRRVIGSGVAEQLTMRDRPA